MKHALLVRLVRALQKKDKGFLYLDTHAGRGHYDLAVAAEGDSRARKPEWPDGIGRLWTRGDLPAGVAEYLALVREFDRRQGNLEASPRFYPGSPEIVRTLARPQDRLALCELHPAEFAALRDRTQFSTGVSWHAMDGYIAPRAMLPPPERRALVLMDPPFEAQDEFARLAKAMEEGWKRLPGGVFAAWYALTERARVNEFFDAVYAAKPPPTLVIELTIAGDSSPLRMKGCGLLIVNPPWQFDGEAREMMDFLADTLALSPGGGARVEWLVPEK